MESRKVIVYYKKQSKFNNSTGEDEVFQRPPFETVESNIPAHEKLYGGIIKEIKLKESNVKIPLTQVELKKEGSSQEITDKITFLTKENERLLAQNVNLTVKLQDKSTSVEITDKSLVEHFIKKDKTPLSISKYLNISIEEVNKLLPETATV